MSAARSVGRSGVLRFGVSILVSVTLVTFLLRDIEPARIFETLRGAYFPGVAMGSLAFGAMVVGRVLRYRVLLETPVGLMPLTGITLVRGMLGDLLPARLGTLSYVYLVTTRAGVPLDQALASFLLALVLDMVAIAPLLLIALVAVGGGAGASALVGLSVALLIVAVAGTLALGWGLRLTARLIAGAADSKVDGDDAEQGGWRGRLAGTLLSTAAEVDAVRARGALLPALGLSFVVRIAKFGAHWLFLQAVLVPLGVPWGSMDFFTGFLGVAGAELSAMLPISGIAAIGTWEVAWTLAFTRLGLTEQQAVLSGFATHILSQVHDYVLGIAALLALMWPRPVVDVPADDTGGRGR